MEVAVQRGGLTLRGVLEGTDHLENHQVAILFHGFQGNRGYQQGQLLYDLSATLNAAGIPTLRFDFAGCGESQGKFVEMTVLSEILDGMQIIDFARSQMGAKQIYLIGHLEISVHGQAVGGQYFRTAQLLPIYETAQHFAKPALLIHGLADQVVSPEASRKYNVILPQSQLHLLPGEDHMLEGQRLPEIKQLVTDFIKE